jgi:hypothetical protein
MKVLIEHTAFHSIGKCLSGNSNSPTDIENLIQICIQIIFCDEVILSTSLPTDVIGRSGDLISKVDPNNVGAIKIGINNTSYAKTPEVCQIVADELASDIDIILSSYDSVSDSSNFMPILSENQTNQFSEISRAIQKNDRTAILTDLKEISFSEKNDGLLSFIMSKNEELCNKILKYAQRNTWNFDKTTRLISDVRTVLNDHLAKDAGVIYSPSVLRAREENKKFDLIVSHVYEISEEYSKRLKGPSINLPSFSDLLISQGKGDPLRIVEAALEMREAFSPLREFLNQKTKDLSFERCNAQMEVLHALNELAGVLYQTVAPGGQPGPMQMVINTVINFSKPLAELKSVYNWSQYIINKGRIRAFTEMSQRMIFTGGVDRYKELLLCRSQRNRSSQV